MGTAVLQLLKSFNALPEADKHQAAVEILREISATVEENLPETALVGAVEELFRALDAEER